MLRAQTAAAAAADGGTHRGRAWPLARPLTAAAAEGEEPITMPLVGQVARAVQAEPVGWAVHGHRAADWLIAPAAQSQAAAAEPVRMSLL